MNHNLDNNWKKILENDLNMDYFKKIESFILNELNDNKIIYPPLKDTFNALNLTPFNNVNVVIIGQDPYHGTNQAHGLSFSVKDGIKHPPSLSNIFKELTKDLGIPYPKNGNLTSWSKQGVLLLNATLTVEESKANSHQNIGWQKFTDSIIKHISDEKEGVIFLLWGGFARKKGAKIDKLKHYILETGHPSPLSANRGYWFGNNHFSKTNELLKKMGKTPIDWEIQ